MSSANEPLLSIIEKAWFTSSFLDQMSNNYAPFFNKISLVVIPSYIDLSWSRLCIHVLAKLRDLYRILFFNFYSRVGNVFMKLWLLLRKNFLHMNAYLHVASFIVKWQRNLCQKQSQELQSKSKVKITLRLAHFLNTPSLAIT